MTTVLITGAAGFCGPHLARRLHESGGMRVIGASRRHPDPVDAPVWNRFVKLDAMTAAEMEPLIAEQQPDWIFHLAGSFTGSEAHLHEGNVATTEILLTAVRRHVPEASVLLVGSAAEYGAVPLNELPVRETQMAVPETPYGRAKLAATNIGLAHVREWGANVRIARPFNIVGAGAPTSLVSGALIERVRRVACGAQTAVPVGNIDTQRDFIAVTDVVDAYVAMMTAECVGEIINVCSGRPQSIRTLIDILRKITGHPIPIERDATLVRPGDLSISYGSLDKAHSLWGFTPKISLKDAMAAAWNRVISVPTAELRQKT